MIVVDASVMASALIDDGDSGNIARRRLMSGASLHAPQLLDLEVLSVLRRQVALDRMTERRALLAIEDLLDLDVVHYPHAPFAMRTWELRRNLTPYDAVYVALAETLECPLVTADSGIGKAPGLRCRVETLRA